MERYALFLVMKDIVKEIDANIKCSKDDMDFNAPGSCGIYFRNGGVSNYRELATGEYYNYKANVEFVMTSGNDKQSLMNLMSNISRLRNTLQKYCNVVVENGSIEQLKWVDDVGIVYDPNNEKGGVDIIVNIAKTTLMSDVSFIGKTQQGLPKYTLDVRCDFSIGHK